MTGSAAVGSAPAIVQEADMDDDVLRTAGEVMQGERDALLKLIQSLRHEYEAVQAAKMGQESELQGLKVQPCPAHDMLHHLCMPGYI